MELLFSLLMNASPVSDSRIISDLSHISSNPKPHTSLFPRLSVDGRLGFQLFAAVHPCRWCGSGQCHGRRDTSGTPSSRLQWEVLLDSLCLSIKLRRNTVSICYYWDIADRYLSQNNNLFFPCIMND